MIFLLRKKIEVPTNALSALTKLGTSGSPHYFGICLSDTWGLDVQRTRGQRMSTWDKPSAACKPESIKKVEAMDDTCPSVRTYGNLGSRISSVLRRTGLSHRD